MWTSKYNFRVPLENGVLLYNANSGAVRKFEGANAEELCILLSGQPIIFPTDLLSEEVLHGLISNGFLVTNPEDELDIIRKRYQIARGETPMVLTLTTTMDCNLGCYYCYESRTKQTLKITDIPSIINLVEDILKNDNKGSLHVDWYGGEPLMNIEFFEAASLALQNFCQERNINYVASVISNGTCWPEDITDFVKRHKINQIQITFDGLEANHNKRRRYRREFDKGESSFQQAIELIDKLVNCCRVDVRYNMDKNNIGDLLPFIDFIRKRGWFDSRYPVTLQPARISSFSLKSSFLRKHELSVDEYDEHRANIRNRVGFNVRIEESEAPDGFPYPRTSVCAALANNSVVIGADGATYRCGVQVGENNRAVGNIRESSPSQKKYQDEKWWREYDPTNNITCSKCSFLPICWGGCPKKHLEGDKHALAEQGAYWRKNLPRLIATKFGERVQNGYTYNEGDQFR